MTVCKGTFIHNFLFLKSFLNILVLFQIFSEESFGNEGVAIRNTLGQLQACLFSPKYMISSYSKQDFGSWSSRIKGCPQADYTWTQIREHARSFEQIEQFEVNSQMKSVIVVTAKKIEFIHDWLTMKTNAIQITREFEINWFNPQ